MKEARIAMNGALKEFVIPKLRELGFQGSIPHFRRMRDECIDLLTFQFSQYGSKFVVEVARCPVVGVTSGSGKHFSPEKVRTYNVPYGARLRLGSIPGETDHWFDFENLPHAGKTYRTVAEQVIQYFPQAETHWATRHDRIV